MSARNNINLSTIGEIINKQWQDINDQYDDVELDEYVIMPNPTPKNFIRELHEFSRTHYSTQKIFTTDRHRLFQIIYYLLGENE